MTDFLTPGPLSLAEIINIIRIQSRDQTAKPVFENDDIKLAIRQAVINSKGKWYTAHTTELAYVSGTDTYTVADDIQRIMLVTRERVGLDSIQNTLNSTSPDQDIVSFRHLPMGRGENKLVFFREYLTSTLTLYYERDIPIPIDDRTLSVALTAEATTMTLVDSSPQLWRLTLPVWFKVDDEIIKITAATDNTTATIARAQLGSIAAAHISGSTISQIVASDSDAFYAFLFSEVGRLLNLWRVQAGSGSVDVSANITAMRFFREDRDEVAANRPQPRRVKKMKFIKDRRPRRGI